MRTKSKHPKVKSCPCCRFPVLLTRVQMRDERGFTDGYKYEIFCANCGLSIRKLARWAAIKAWNRRTGFDDALRRTHTVLDIAMKTLGQIATTPRNRGARQNALATIEFIETQLAALSDKEPNE